MGTAHSFESRRSSGGQLGVGDELDWWGPRRVQQLSTGGELIPQDSEHDEQRDWTVKQVACGFNHTAAVIEMHEFA